MFFFLKKLTFYFSIKTFIFFIFLYIRIKRKLKKHFFAEEIENTKSELRETIQKIVKMESELEKRNKRV